MERIVVSMTTRLRSLDALAPTVQTHGRAKTFSEITLPLVAEPALVARTNKPPYRIPLIAEIRAVPDSGLRLVSTFSGCGGSCLGFAMAGYRTLWANEFIPAAADVYRLNHSGVMLDTRSIRDITAADILAAIGLVSGEIDVLEGSPPCASFSTAGKRQAHWGKVKKYSDGSERTDDLFFEFVRLLAELQPRAFVAENVSGLVKGVAKGYFKLILGAMKAAGYRVDARMLDAQWLGVPQRRKRVIFVGVRTDLNRAPAFPRPLVYRYSVGDALSDVATIASEDSETAATAEQLAAWKRTVGGSCFDYSWSKKKTGRTLPSPTVGVSRDIFHHSEPRTFTIAELRRICGFPDDFILTGTYAQQWERLGRAVPPPMMAAVARVLRDEILYAD